jgi:small conductance mechanosensitive channel
MTWELVAATTGRLVEAWIIRVLIGLAIALITWQLAKWARTSFDRAARRGRADANARLLAGRLIYGAVWVLGLIWLLSLVGVDQAGILATFGAFGLALGLAVQDILKSFFAGLYLLFERPFLIGDEIEVKEQVGRVEEVGFRATTIRTEDNTVIVVPNAIIFSEVVANRSARVPSSEPRAPSSGEMTRNSEPETRNSV